MKTYLEKHRFIIFVMRLAGIAGLIASIANLLGYGTGNWEQNMTIGLLWLILAGIEESICRFRDN